MTSTRDQIIATTCDLLEAQGYYATGLNQIVAESGAPKGSLYYYFPDGKEEITSEAIDRLGRTVAHRIRQALGGEKDAVAAVRRFVCDIAGHVEAAEFRAGGPLTTVALETVHSSERLNRACRSAYDRLQSAFEDRLLADGFPEARAAELATFITAAIEGGILLSRTFHSGAPLRQVADQLGQALRAAHEASDEN